MTYQKIDLICQYIQDKQLEGFDFVIAISGRERMGKSTLSLVLAQRLTELMREHDPSFPKFSIEKNICYTQKEALQKLKSLPDGSVFIADEAIRLLYKRQWQSQQNIEFIQTMAQIGIKRMIFFFNLPSFWDLERQMREHRVSLWIHVIRRGQAVVFKADRSAMSSSKWHEKEFVKSVPFIGDVDTDKEISLYSKALTYLDSFQFPDIDNRMRAEYDALSRAAKLATDEEIESGATEKNNKKGSYEERYAATLEILNKLGKTHEQISHDLKNEGIDLRRGSISLVLRDYRRKIDEAVQPRESGALPKKDAS